MQDAEASVSRTATYRAEPVGSLLRPAPLKRLFEEIFSAHSSHAVQVLTDEERGRLEELESVAEEAIREAVNRQLSIGLDVVTDGEMRRAHYVNSLFDAFGGLGENEQPEYFAGDEGVAPPPEPTAQQPLHIVDNPLAREIAFVRTLTDHPSKVTIQAPSSFYFPASSYSSGAYGSREEFVGHVVELSRELVRGAVEAGARYVQFDYPLYPALCDPEKRAELVGALGEAAESLLAKALVADNAVLEDTERQGDYSALRFVPEDGPVVVMGVVSSKLPELESDDEILRRMEAAARYLDIGRLAISPQCGFASVWYGNELSEDDQWRKLELVTRTANKIWD